MFGERIKPGSTFLFGLIRILLILFGSTGVALIAMAIWLWLQIQDFSWPQIVFIAFGVFQLALMVLGCTAQTSTPKLKCFLYIMSLLFIAELTITIVIFATGDKIIDEIIDATHSQQERDQMKDKVFYVNAVVVGTLVVQLLLISFVKCYIGSLRERNSEFDYKFVDDEGNKLTVDQKQMNDRKNVEEKYSKKRQEMYQKYGKPPS